MGSRDDAAFHFSSISPRARISARLIAFGSVGAASTVAHFTRPMDMAIETLADWSCWTDDFAMGILDNWR